MKPLFSSREAAAAQVARSLAAVAATDLPLLVEGETGTGKSWVAARVHRVGRAGRPLVVVDCGATPEALFPAEVFGHRAGAFTDATRARRGALDRAANGTVVLDRLDVLPMSAQVALLRALEERRFTPLGSSDSAAVQARFICIVGSGVKDAVKAGIFRADLFHRVAGLHAVLPPLRERAGDILPFARSFLRRRARSLGRPLHLTVDAEAALLAYGWPGNFRELETILARALLLGCEETIDAAALGLSGTWDSLAAPAALKARTLREIVRSFALSVLAREGGNVSRAARSLGISRRTLLRWREEQ